MSNPIVPGSSADVNVQVRALGIDPNVSVQYKTVILKKNLVSGVNTLTQAMMNQTNTKYVIKYDYTLGENITVPANCVLEFDGGSLSNGTINGNATVIVNIGDAYIFKESLNIGAGFNFEYLDIRWFGAVSDLIFVDGIGSGTDCHNALQKAINTSYNYYGIPIKIIGRYYLGSSVTIEDALCLQGNRIPVKSYGVNPPNIDTISTLYIKKGITAFVINGRANAGNTMSTGNFYIKNIHFTSEWQIDETNRIWTGEDTELIKITTTGGPSRPCSFIENTVEAMYRVINIDSAGDNKLSNVFDINIERNHIMFCDTFMRVNAETDMSIGCVNVSNNVIEHNLHTFNINRGIYGSFNIHNNLLENSGGSYIKMKQGASCIIDSNYFEGMYGDFIIEGIPGMQQNIYVSIVGNTPYKESHNNFYILSYVHLRKHSNYNHKELKLRNSIFLDDIQFPNDIFIVDVENSDNNYVLITLSKNNVEYINLQKTDYLNGEVSGNEMLTSEGNFVTRTPVNTWDITRKDIKADANDVLSITFAATGGDNLMTLLFSSNYGAVDLPSVYTSEEFVYKIFVKTPAGNNMNVGFRYNGTKNVVIGSYFINNETKNPLPINAFVRAIQGGKGATRPNSCEIGAMFFDTSLSPAKPIWWNGTAWVDATGTTV